MGPGALVLVVGPSGSGKDTLLRYARERIDDPRIVFCRRIITRDTSAHEDHDIIGEAAFDEAAARDAFALHWRAHGLSYALPASTDAALSLGDAVVANASRAVVPQARDRYRNVRVVWLDVPPAVARDRLLARSRETADDVAKRLERADAIAPSGADVTVLDNSGPIAVAGERLVALLLDAVAGTRTAQPAISR
ncbi:MAG: phosphonate metabolism protein/1,5-bisphosphokinase (PRPP-forming) PhnN [Bauldia sp.]|nr:phosphonate metabolism protein/1,5-bisphosphokinase (PRPP-forming) PhnN [Bauldia sp.]